MKYTTLLSFFTLLVIGFLLSSRFSFAQKDSRSYLKMTPAYQDVTLKKNESSKLIIVKIQNTTSANITLLVTSVDIAQKPDTGRIDYVQKNTTYSLSPHIKILTPQVELKSGQTQQIQAEIINNEALSPGGHYAALVAQVQQTTKKNAVTPSISSLIFLKKEGEIKTSLTINSIVTKLDKIHFFYPQDVKVSFFNDGNTHLTPYGRVEIYDFMQRLLYKGTLNESSAVIFPQSKRTITAAVQKLSYSFPISYNTIVVYGEDGTKLVTYSYKQKFFYINPLFLVFLVIIFSFVFKYKRKLFKNGRFSIRSLKKSGIVKEVKH